MVFVWHHIYTAPSTNLPDYLSSKLVGYVTIHLSGIWYKMDGTDLWYLFGYQRFQFANSESI